MATTENGGGDHVVELSVHERSALEIDAGVALELEEISPLLIQAERPKINIFTISYPRKKPREPVTRLVELETSPVSQFVFWVWGGSRHSGILCMAVSSTIYFLMGVVSNIFSVQSIPLFETAFTRCTIILICSYMWLNKTGQSIRGLANFKYLLISRAFVGYLSLMSFIYCIQRLPFSQATLLSFTTPILASVMARIFLHEKLKIAEIGANQMCGLLHIEISHNRVGYYYHHGILPPTNHGFLERLRATFYYGCIVWLAVSLGYSSFAVECLLHKMHAGGLVNNGEGGNPSYIWGSNHVYAILVGLFSALTGGISYCLIRAGAKASDQPMATVFSFGVLSSPAAGICSFALEDFVLPGLYSFTLMVVLGILAFFAEVFLARALQLEKTSKVANVLFFEAALSQLWGIGWLMIAPSFGQLVGCLLIVISVCYTMYFGPDKEVN